MRSNPSVADAAKKLANTFSGQLLRPRDVGYDDARKVHNGLVDKRPALIARAGGVADIVGAVELAQNLNLEVAVRGGGHNVAGRATIDGGLIIDLAPMKGIYVDPVARTARAQGASPGPSSTARRSCTGLRSPAVSCQPPESRGSRSEVDWAGSWANTGWRLTTFDP